LLGQIKVNSVKARFNCKCQPLHLWEH